MGNSLEGPLIILEKAYVDVKTGKEGMTGKKDKYDVFYPHSMPICPFSNIPENGYRY